MSWREELELAVQDFFEVAELGGIHLLPAAVMVELLPAPHNPPTRLPAGKKGVYAFWGDGGWLKIGKAGAKSSARYTSQHYNPASARSTLASSLQSCGTIRANPTFDATAPGAWLKQYAHRANILMDAGQPEELLALLEAFLHLRLKPRYEGRGDRAH
jgi:hypothetical protein